jgi:hypothetical protein
MSTPVIRAISVAILSGFLGPPRFAAFRAPQQGLIECNYLVRSARAKIIGRLEILQNRGGPDCVQCVEFALFRARPMD